VRSELETRRNEAAEVARQLAETSENLSQAKSDLEETRRTSQVRFMSRKLYRQNSRWFLYQNMGWQ